jgi:hypothetical protein
METKSKRLLAADKHIESLKLVLEGMQTVIIDDAI